MFTLQSSAVIPHFCLDNWMLVMSTQLLGFSIGGISHRFLVAPPPMSMSLAFRLLLLNIQTVHYQSGLIHSYFARFSIRSTRKLMLAQARTMGLPGNGTSFMPLLLLPFGVGTFLPLISAELIENHLSNFAQALFQGIYFKLSGNLRFRKKQF